MFYLPCKTVPTIPDPSFPCKPLKRPLISKLKTFNHDYAVLHFFHLTWQCYPRAFCAHRYQAIPQAPFDPYERNTAPAINRTRVSTPRSPPPHLVRAPMYVPVRSSNNIGATNSPTLTPLPSHPISHYTVAPSGHMGADRSSGLQLPTHAFAGPSNAGQSAGRVVIGNETSESYGCTFFEFLWSACQFSAWTSGFYQLSRVLIMYPCN